MLRGDSPRFNHQDSHDDGKRNSFRFQFLDDSSGRTARNSPDTCRLAVSANLLRVARIGNCPWRADPVFSVTDNRSPTTRRRSYIPSFIIPRDTRRIITRLDKWSKDSAAARIERRTEVRIRNSRTGFHQIRRRAELTWTNVTISNARPKEKARSSPSILSLFCEISQP